MPDIGVKPHQKNLITTKVVNAKIKPLTPIARKRNSLFFMAKSSRLVISWLFIHELFFNSKQKLSKHLELSLFWTPFGH
ncbi:hypothetical protein CXF62_01290 (plasmid) [Psychrobacter sp. MES7-P7E]|nr:hypothetical protein CXF62_01290 [Psychrobacter sp. MES7-P7E]